MNRKSSEFRSTPCAALLVALLAIGLHPAASAQPAAQAGDVLDGDPASCAATGKASPYIPVDSWIYPAVLRLYSLGFVDRTFIGMRPWTRSALLHLIDEEADTIQYADPGPATDQAQAIYESLSEFLRNDRESLCSLHKGSSNLESVYSVMRAMSGDPLHDSFHLGSTVVNDYGRPFSRGFNNYSGVSGYLAFDRFVLYARGEFRGAPSMTGYSPALAATLASIDGTTYFLNSTTPIPYNQQATIPAGPMGASFDGRWIEAYVSAHILNNEISFGKQDEWLGPGRGGGMAYSNNAENLYSFRINRVEPLKVPLLSTLVGPFRYDFVVGPLKGHVYPNAPWMHLEQVSFKPSENLEFGFERTVIWGGKGHEPITLHTFLRSLFSTVNVTSAVKNSPSDPGARFSAFYFSYRLPLLRNWLTLYSDSEAHDDVFPISAPRRASIRPGLYLSHVPGMAKLDVRAEAVSTDPPSSRSTKGQFNYYEDIQRQGYTNNGQISGDWIGREAKGGQAWITYHLSGNEYIQVAARNQKTPKDFIPGGTTLNDLSVQIEKRLSKNIELSGSFAYERWKAPIYDSRAHTVTNTTIQITWFPERKTEF